MSPETEPKPADKAKTLAKQILGWGIVIGGVVVGLKWFISATTHL